MYALVHTINTECIQTNFGTYVFFLGWHQWTNIFWTAIHTQTHDLRPTCEAQKAEFAYSFFGKFIKNEATIEMAADSVSKCFACFCVFVLDACVAVI